MAKFHPLRVAQIRRETRDSVVLTLEPEPEARDAFAFTQGQYLTFRRLFDGEDVRRSYSICAGRGDGVLRVGVKKVPGGCFSTWANDELAEGEVLEAMPPMGAFHTPLDPSQARSYVAFAAGSGITPILSIIKTTLAEEPKSDFTLVYGNRSSNSIMFREELEDLKNEHLGRLTILHVLSRESQDIDLFNGRIDAEKTRALARHWINLADVDAAFICGPQEMMLEVSAALKEGGLAEDRIKFELFASSQPGRPRRQQAAAAEAAAAETCAATVVMDGVSRSFDMPKQGQTVLDAAIAEGMDAPFACKGGVCSTCRAMLLEGEVEMDANFALEDYEVRRGYILTCQSYPVTDKVVVDYDQ